MLRRTSTVVLIPVAGVALALGTIAMFLWFTGADVPGAFSAMASAAFGDRFALSSTLIKAMPRLFSALGIALALRGGLWNIGAEGQMYIGAIAATGIALYTPTLGAFTIVLAIVAGALAGAGWGAVPGVLRSTRGINEVITSLLMVYVAIQLANYLVEGPWLPPSSTFAASAPLPASVRLPVIWDGTLLNAGFVIAILAVPAIWFIVSRTSFGLRLRALGGNPEATRFAGVPIGGMIVSAMAISGALAGLGGAVEVLGVRGKLIAGFSPGYGFEAIAIALLGRLHPGGILGAALLFGALDAGGAGLQTGGRGIPSAIVLVTEGLAVIYVLAGFGIWERNRRRRRAEAAIADAESRDEDGRSSKEQ